MFCNKSIGSWNTNCACRIIIQKCPHEFEGSEPPESGGYGYRSGAAILSSIADQGYWDNCLAVMTGNNYGLGGYMDWYDAMPGGGQDKRANWACDGTGSDDDARAPPRHDAVLGRPMSCDYHHEAWSQPRNYSPCHRPPLSHTFLPFASDASFLWKKILKFREIYKHLCENKTMAYL